MASGASKLSSPQTRLSDWRAALTQFEKALTCGACGNICKDLQTHMKCGSAICTSCYRSIMTTTTPSCPCCHLDCSAQDDVVELQNILELNSNSPRNARCGDNDERTSSNIVDTGDPFLIWATVEAIIGRAEEKQHNEETATTIASPLNHQRETHRERLVHRNNFGGLTFYRGSTRKSIVTGRIGRLGYEKQELRQGRVSKESNDPTKQDASTFDFHSQSSMPNSQENSGATWNDERNPAHAHGDDCVALRDSSKVDSKRMSPSTALSSAGQSTMQTRECNAPDSGNLLERSRSANVSFRVSLKQPPQIDAATSETCSDVSSQSMLFIDSKTPHCRKLATSTPSDKRFVTPSSSMAAKAVPSHERFAGDSQSTISSRTLPNTEQFDLLLKAPAQATPCVGGNELENLDQKSGTRFAEDSQASISSHLLPDTEQFDLLLNSPAQQPKGLADDESQSASKGSQLLPSTCDYATLFHDRGGLEYDVYSQSQPSTQGSSASQRGSATQISSTEASIQSQLLPNTFDFEELLYSRSELDSARRSVSTALRLDRADEISHIDACMEKASKPQSLLSAPVCVLYDESIQDNVFDCLERLDHAHLIRLVQYCSEVKHPPKKAVPKELYATHFVPCAVNRPHPFQPDGSSVSACLRTFGYLRALAMRLSIASPEWLRACERNAALTSESEWPVWGDTILYDIVRSLQNDTESAHEWIRKTTWWGQGGGPATTHPCFSLEDYNVTVIPSTSAIVEVTADGSRNEASISVGARPLIKEEIQVLCKLLRANVLTDVSDLVDETGLGRCRTTLILITDGTPWKTVSSYVNALEVGQHDQSNHIHLLRVSWLIDSIAASSLAPIDIYKFPWPHE